MKAEELRIGNWVKYYETIGRVVEISNRGGQFVTMNSHPIEGYSHGQYAIERITPIPLTPEILEKAGFVDTEADGYYERSIDLPDLIHSVRKVLYLSTNMIDGWAVYLRDEYIALIHNLHQLQNLYFAITSSELPINL